jgi:4-hydroxybenzoate polyprenyltransferase
LEKVTQPQELQETAEMSDLSPSPVGPVSSSGTWQRIRALIQALRPRQWTKNFAVFIGLIFAQQLFSPVGFERASLAFLIFCVASSSIYLLNDLLDLENDRQHPVKRLRPLASGRLPKIWAKSAIGILLLGDSALILLLFRLPMDRNKDIFATFGGANLLFTLTVAGYLLIMVLYGIRLKHIVLIDVFIIAGGFVLRILAGAIVIPVDISPWLYIVTSQLSLFLALCKRRNELVLLQGQAGTHRQILKEYSIPMLNQMITIVVATTIMAYSLYTFQGPTGNHRLLLTLPLVLYGLFRYLYLVYMKEDGGSPEEILLRDPHMIGTVLLCTGLIVILLYLLPQ